MGLQLQQLQEAWGIADRLGLVGPAVEQSEYSLFTRQKVRAGSHLCGQPAALMGRRWCLCHVSAGRGVDGDVAECAWAQVESDFLPLYASKGLGLTTWSPLAYGEPCPPSMRTSRPLLPSQHFPIYCSGGFPSLSPVVTLGAGLLSGKYSKDHVPEGSRFAMEQ